MSKSRQHLQAAGMTLGLFASQALAQSPYWMQVATTGPAARSEHAIAYDSQRGLVVLFGGLNSQTSTAFGDTWEWNGSAWTQRATSGSRPLARSGHAMAYDSSRGVVVLFGGHAPVTGFFGDTWEWDGSTWTLKSSGGGPPTSPLPASGHAMAYDRLRGVTVLFGGSLSQSPTWEWDGNAWTRITLTGPPPRDACAMIYDEQRHVCVLFGGNTSFPDCNVWEWDGAAWSSRGCSWGVAPMNHAMSFDSRRNMVVRYGGWHAQSGFRNADTFESTAYLQSSVCSNCSPGALSGHAMTYDGNRGITVLIGGSGSGGDLGDTWEWSGFRSHGTNGFGNACGNPPLLCWTDAAAPPVLGTTAKLQLANVPGPLAFVALGWRNDVLANPPSSLPLSLAPLGMPNCWLFTSSESPWNAVLATNGTGELALPLPSIMPLLGHHLFLQPWAPAPGANTVGLVFSNGQHWVLGNQ